MTNQNIMNGEMSNMAECITSFIELIGNQIMFPLVVPNMVTTIFSEYDENVALCQVHVNAYMKENQNINMFIKYVSIVRF